MHAQAEMQHWNLSGLLTQPNAPKPDNRLGTCTSLTGLKLGHFVTGVRGRLCKSDNTSLSLTLTNRCNSLHSAGVRIYRLQIGQG